MSKQMILESFDSAGLAHRSYLVGHDGEAAVVDPRRDVDCYLEAADRHNLQISTVLETHRNEDYLVGSCELAARTGARILHGAATDFGYGEPAREGDRIELGDLALTVIETPGHTHESLSFALSVRSQGDEPLAVFTGDALFIGDVGRTDFYDKPEEAAAELWEGLHNKLLPLGDQAILCPAHGAGSVCGSGMAPRNFSTLGFERRHNPRLAMSRDEFVDHKATESHDVPPYFRRMERLNQEGPPLLDLRRRLSPLSPSRFDQRLEAGSIAIDVRGPEAFCGGSVPEALAIPLEMLAPWAGWYLENGDGRELLLIADSSDQAQQARQRLGWLGYDDVGGYLTDLRQWQTDGRPWQSVTTVQAEEIERRQRAASSADVRPFTLLDVRRRAEYDAGHLPGAVQIHAGEVEHQIDRLPLARPVTVLCSSGMRATIAASVLRREGVADVEVLLGSMQAMRAIGAEVES